MRKREAPRPTVKEMGLVMQACITELLGTGTSPTFRALPDEQKSYVFAYLAGRYLGGLTVLAARHGDSLEVAWRKMCAGFAAYDTTIWDE